MNSLSLSLLNRCGFDLGFGFWLGGWLSGRFCNCSGSRSLESFSASSGRFAWSHRSCFWLFKGTGFASLRRSRCRGYVTSDNCARCGLCKTRCILCGHQFITNGLEIIDSKFTCLRHIERIDPLVLDFRQEVGKRFGSATASKCTPFFGCLRRGGAIGRFRKQRTLSANDLQEGLRLSQTLIKRTNFGDGSAGSLCLFKLGLALRGHLRLLLLLLDRTQNRVIGQRTGRCYRLSRRKISWCQTRLER